MIDVETVKHIMEMPGVHSVCMVHDTLLVEVKLRNVEEYNGTVEELRNLLLNDKWEMVVK